jgi:hypothetical protein
VIEPWTRVRTLHNVYLTPSVHSFPSTCPLLCLTGLHQRPRSTSLYTRLLIKSYYMRPPSITLLSAPHSFYNYIRIRTHHVSNQHVTVISPAHPYAHISCCIVTVISPRNLLRALTEHIEATFSPPTCASNITPLF